jgi:glutathione S-transferase
MSEIVLVMGNCNYSSWSLRAWLALEQTGISFREQVIWFDEDHDRSQRRNFSPTGRVPVLLHGEIAIWDGLAIGEYLAELEPEAGLWPLASPARARARSLCAEMHSGFPAVREQMPLNVRARSSIRRDESIDSEIQRLTSMWDNTRREYGADGPFLFGERTLADAFYAPVACRFRSYGVPLEGEAGDWMETVLEMPAMQIWTQRGETEGHPDPDYDI